MSWQPTLGAWPDGDGVRFRVWAPAAQRVAVRIEPSNDVPLQPEPGGYHATHVPGLIAGARYRYVLDDDAPLPDMASRFQPEGVHGPSEVIDPRAFRWSDAAWRGLDRDALSIYELHVGTFTREGTFAAATRELPLLADLGVSAVELMPVADFAGNRNWGYDGVDLFAPARCYGRPDDLRAFVDAAHALGIGVILDVVYNHFGPDGAYHSRYAAQFFNPARQTPWGAAINFSGPGNESVRGFFIENSLHWMHEYHVDGFRLDATHEFRDDGAPPCLAEYATAIHNADTGRLPAVVIAEDHRNLNTILRPSGAGGSGFDGVWADDFHHAMRRFLAGDHEGYFQDYRGTTEEIASALTHGWTYTGQQSAFWGEPRGTDPAGLSPPRFVHCLQNHDQIGNRAFGERLNRDVPLPAVRAATALLLCSADTPLLFMGQEWAASAPFLYFTDHMPELGRLVTEGRRNEFRHWAAFADPTSRARIPDPQDESTFLRCKLDVDERSRPPHAATLRLHRALLHMRRDDATLAWTDGSSQQRAAALDADAVALRRDGPRGALLVIARLRGAGAHGDSPLLAPPAGASWQPVLTTEDADFADDPSPIDVQLDGDAPRIHFARPGAVLLRADGSRPDA